MTVKSCVGSRPFPAASSSPSLVNECPIFSWIGRLFVDTGRRHVGHHRESCGIGLWEPSGTNGFAIFNFFWLPVSKCLRCNLTKYIHSEYFVLMACNTLWQNNIGLDFFIQIQQFWTISFGDFSAMVGPNQKWFSQYTAPLLMLSSGIWFLLIGAMPSAKSE